VLLKCYEKLSTIVVSDIECFDVVNKVDAYRKMYKPKKTKVVLLAESHVFTKDSDMVELKFPNGIDCSQDKYVRFVYCLGYGENRVLSKDVHPNNGTPDY